jgi:thymidylate synthase
MKSYLDIIEKILAHGESEADTDGEVRTGIKTKKLFCETWRHDMRTGFPMCTTKPMFIRGIIHEFIWMMARGDTNIRYLLKNDVHFWSEWPHKNFQQMNDYQGGYDMCLAEFEAKVKHDDVFAAAWGDIGMAYGAMFRVGMYGHDQLANVVKLIKEQPLGRRHIISGWDPRCPDKALLPPCHGNHIQFDVSKGYLDCMMVQRSCDMVLGVPFNIAFYGILLEVIAKITGYTARNLSIVLNNVHIYENHYDAAEELLGRQPMPLPSFTWGGNSLEDMCDFDLYKFSEFEHHPKLKSPAKIAI